MALYDDDESDFDESDFQDLLKAEDSSKHSNTPYTSVANAPANPAIKNHLMNRGSPAAAPMTPSSSPPPPVAPELAQYQKDQSDLNASRQAKLGADFSSNLGQSLSQIALGASDPKANPVYNKIDTQNQNLLESQDKDLDRKRKVMDAIEARKSRQGIAQQTSDIKNTLLEDKLSKALKADLDPNGPRSGNFGSNQKRVDNAERIQALLEQVHGNPDPRQMEELAIASQAMLSSSGTPAAEQVKALIPKTALGDFKKFKEWLMNDPTGTGQQAFVARMADTVAREKAVAERQVKNVQRQRLSAHGLLKSKFPDTYNALVHSYHFDEDGENKKGMSAEQEQGMADALKSSSVRIQAPDGTIRLIPAEHVQDALAAGGKSLE